MQRWQEASQHNTTAVGHIVGSPAPQSSGAGAVVKEKPSRPGTGDERKKKQMLANQTLIDEVDKHEGRSLRQAARISDAPAAQKQDISTRNDLGLKLITEFLKGYQWTHMPAVSRQELYEKCKLELPWETMQMLFARFTDAPGSDIYYNLTVRALVDGQGEPEKVVEQLSKVSSEKNLVAPYVLAVCNFYALSGREFLDVPQILKMLRQSDPHVEHLRHCVDEKYEERRHHIEGTEDMQAAERAHNIIDDLLEELMDLYSERIELLEGAGQDDSFCTRLQDAGQTVKQLHDDAVKHMLPIPGVPARDIDRLDEAVRDTLEAKKEDIEKIEHREQMLLDCLRDNAVQQLGKFDAIEQKYKEVLDLAQERKALVEQLMQERQEHETRKAAADRFVIEANEHKRVLENLQRALAAGPPTCVPSQTTHPWVDRILRAVEEQVSDARRDTSDTLLREQRAFYKVFSEFYLVCGELLFNKERRLEEVEGQIEDARWNLSMIKATLDPNVKLYKERLKTLETQVVPCEKEIRELKRRMDKAASEAQPVEDILIEHGDPVVSPVIELQERNSERQASILQARKVQVGHRASKVELQEEDAARMADTARVAKSAGATTSSMRPLSPDATGSSMSPPNPVRKRELAEHRRRNYVERLRRNVNAASDPILAGSRHRVGGEPYRPHGGVSA